MHKRSDIGFGVLQRLFVCEHAIKDFAKVLSSENDNRFVRFAVKEEVFRTIHKLWLSNIDKPTTIRWEDIVWTVYVEEHLGRLCELLCAMAPLIVHDVVDLYYRGEQYKNIGEKYQIEKIERRIVTIADCAYGYFPIMFCLNKFRQIYTQKHARFIDLTDTDRMSDDYKKYIQFARNYMSTPSNARNFVADMFPTLSRRMRQ